jgi:predicted hydrocarbon binding protein
MEMKRLSDVDLMEIRSPPFILLRHDFLETMFDPLLRIFHAPGVSMIFMMGRENGVEEIRKIREELREVDAPLTRRDFFDRAFGKLSQTGWGRITVDELDDVKGAVKIRVKSSPFADRCGSESCGGCYFMQGLFAGVTAEVFESEAYYGTPRCQRVQDGSCLLSLVGSMR